MTSDYFKLKHTSEEKPVEKICVLSDSSCARSTWERESCGDGERSAVSIGLEAGKGGAGKKHLCSSIRADPCSTCVCINDAEEGPMQTILSMAPLNLISASNIPLRLSELVHRNI